MDQDSNFKQLLKCRADDYPVFSGWLNTKNQNFTSPENQKEILKEMTSSVLRDIVESIKNANFHSIMVDEISDASNKSRPFFVFGR